jgi:hypothetical protein
MARLFEGCCGPGEQPDENEDFAPVEEPEEPVYEIQDRTVLVFRASVLASALTLAIVAAFFQVITLQLTTVR